MTTKTFPGAIHPALRERAVPIDSLTLYPGNARRHDLGVIRESLRLHGQYRPVVVQLSTRYVLAGNGTVEAARAEGWGEVAADLIDVDDERARAIVLVDNRSGDLASYDNAALVELLQQLPSLDGTGYAASDLEALLIGLQPVSFDPAGADDQGTLDSTHKTVTCPSCGTTFEP